MAKAMPAQRPGQSVQDVRTPTEFLSAVRRLLGIASFAVDLAASRENTVAPRFYSARTNALEQPWNLGGWNWLNPPFSDLAPWVRRAFEEGQRGARTAMLVPAGVGANWWRDHVHGKARILLLNGRLTFVGHTHPYPKDCALLLYSPETIPAYEVWSWALNQAREEIATATLEHEQQLPPGERAFQFMTDHAGAECLAAGILPGYIRRQAQDALTGEAQAQERRNGTIAVVSEIKDDGKPWEGTGGVPEAAPAPPARVAPKVAGKIAPKAPAKVAPKAPAPPAESEVDEETLAAATTAVTGVLEVNAKGLPKMKLRMETFKALKKSDGDDVANTIIGHFFSSDDNVNTLVGPLGFAVSGLNVVPA